MESKRMKLKYVLTEEKEIVYQEDQKRKGEKEKERNSDHDNI